ncbi:MAG: D-glycero-beta-D-manno-heptose-7-phosphate kinase [Acidobacteria bacterium]|nr:D-glycero-beta-D-manno-heptose-7-phosphate kinase [Acidobacteriota bacterium]
MKHTGCDPEILIRAVGLFRGKRILILGDLMLDRFVFGSVSRISPEAPVPVVEIREERAYLGGGANVAANIAALGATAVPVGIVGKDAEGALLREELRAIRAPLGGLVVDRARPTSVKTRIMAGHQQVCRTDREDRSPLSPAAERDAVRKFRTLVPSADAVVVSDYAKGMLTPALLKRTIPFAGNAGKIVCVDPKQNDFSIYRPATVITPNTAELERAAGVAVTGDRELVRAGKRIVRRAGFENLLVTRGDAGMALFCKGSGVTRIPTVAREVFDVTGAGDTVIAVLALGLTAGLGVLESAVLANIAAGIVVGKLGTASAGPEELTAALRAMRPAARAFRSSPRRPA